MKNIDGQLIEWAKQKIEREFHDDVALLIGQLGACKIPTDEQNVAFDFFVPNTEKGYRLAKTFVIEDMGYDLFPICWERLENIADLNETITFALAKGVVLYARTEEDKQRFLSIQKRLNDHLNDRDYCYRKCLEQVDVAMEIYKTMSFDKDICHVRKAAGGIMQYLSMALATWNHTYLGKSYSLVEYGTEIHSYEEKPDGFEAGIEAITNENNMINLKLLSQGLIQSVRDFFASKIVIKKAEQKEYHYEDLAEWYYEARYTFRRLQYYCQDKNAMIAYQLGCYLQIEFDSIQEEFGLKDLDLLGSYHSLDLSILQGKAEQLESYIVSVLKENNVTLRIYDSISEFLEAGN
ncbi:hypothetical protein lbkm_1332 [Lachnospiraceae bacterium KM106-2]|nr:hypothetical protein lbkm_1332 [Lachnospiraceae bacterium KM106-2]